jgi:hypothetical protein
MTLYEVDRCAAHATQVAKYYGKEKESKEGSKEAPLNVAGLTNASWC